MNDVTLRNIDDKMRQIGLQTFHQPKGQGWHRVYLQVPGEIPTQLGRAMFQNGVFQWVKWYMEPNLDGGDIHEMDLYWFRWYTLRRFGSPLTLFGWDMLKRQAIQVARERYGLARAKRDLLNRARAAAGKKPRTARIASPNQRAAAFKVLDEWEQDGTIGLCIR